MTEAWELSSSEIIRGGVRGAMWLSPGVRELCKVDEALLCPALTLGIGGRVWGPLEPEEEGAMEHLAAAIVVGNQ